MSTVSVSTSRAILPGLPLWTIGAPLLAGAIYAGAAMGLGGAYVGLLALGVAVSVFAAVHHAEVVAHRVGEPFGTLVLPCP